LRTSKVHGPPKRNRKELICFSPYLYPMSTASGKGR
jgi:hypothetical protein